MTQEDKLLLIRDLSARLPYGVKFQSENAETVLFIDTSDNEVWVNGTYIDDFKPYLFPLSSMTEEQYETLEKSGILSNCSHSYEYVNPHIHGKSFVFKEFKTYSLELIEWLHKNHFDYRNLINKNLAIDATGLNIY